VGSYQKSFQTLAIYHTFQLKNLRKSSIFPDKLKNGLF